MKKTFNVMKKVLITLCVMALVFLMGTTIYYGIATHLEKDKISDYGNRVEVLGSTINVYSVGSGERTIVLFPGYGTPSPVIDFKPVIEGLKENYRVVVIEPFGYGLSGTTNRERTVDNIVEEMHAVLQKLEIDDFIYMGHSIAGVYGLNYFNKYPNEVKAFIGIDTSVPEQPGGDLPVSLFRFAKKTGLVRFVTTIGDGPMLAEGLTEDEIQQMNYISQKTSMSDLMLDELSMLTQNLENSRGLTLPQKLPVYLFLQENNTGVVNWIPMYEASIQKSVIGKITLIDADHYLHHTHGRFISSQTHEFIQDNIK